MGRRNVGLALLSLALVLPATASAKAPKAAPADPYKVLVVTSTSDARAPPVSTRSRPPSAATAP